jgi:prepilin-type N-terminal cleavage/methylation domain-containing protein
MFIKRKNHYKAFTLIELLIVIAIIGIMAALSWTALNSSKNNVQLENACGDVVSAINKARNYALTGAVPSGTHFVSISSGDGSSYAISTESTSYTLPGGVTFSSGWTCNFTVPSGAPFSCPTSIGLSSSGVSKTINISSAYEFSCQ